MDPLVTLKRKSKGTQAKAFGRRKGTFCGKDMLANKQNFRLRAYCKDDKNTLIIKTDGLSCEEIANKIQSSFCVNKFI